MNRSNLRSGDVYFWQHGVSILADSQLVSEASAVESINWTCEVND